jgi:hypothetical protein
MQGETATTEGAPLVRKRLTGPIYREFIWALLMRKNASNYLEIGVANGETLSRVACPAIGIDPQFGLSNRDPLGN